MASTDDPAQKPMRKFIVTTTVHRPTEALQAFARLSEWQLIVVGDRRTPHADYEQLECHYLHPDEQAQQYPQLSAAIGWNTIQRRNIGFVEAYQLGADVVATVDDDNLPYPDWGEDLHIGQAIEVDLYDAEVGVFDPLAVTESNHLWHRGFPIQLLQERHRVNHIGTAVRRVLIQADLWNGDPDVDAIARIAWRPQVRFDEITRPFAALQPAPFNSQNTFLAREVLPFYAVFPHVGRFDDILGGYFLQRLFPSSLVFNRASVHQARNPQDVVTNLEHELFGYRHTLDLLTRWQDMPLEPEPMPLGLPQKTIDFYKAYRTQFHRKWVPPTRRRLRCDGQKRGPRMSP